MSVDFAALKNKLKEEVEAGIKSVEAALHELEAAVKTAFGFAAPANAEDLPAGGSPLQASELKENGGLPTEVKVEDTTKADEPEVQAVDAPAADKDEEADKQ